MCQTERGDKGSGEAGILAGPMLVDHGIGKEIIRCLLGLLVVAATVVTGLEADSPTNLCEKAAGISARSK